jgi:type II secretory pathway pseudopilin PulG
MQYCAYCGNAVEAVSYVPCPRCGNPSNGAPRPIATAKGSNTAIIIVFVIAGLLVVVAIAGILAAIAIPNLLTAMQRSKQKRTMADIRSLGTAVESYATDNNQYPKTTDALAPKYIKSVPTVDGWGHELHYTCIKDAASPQSDTCAGYVIASAGKDGRFEHDALETLAGQEPQPTASFDCDIVFSGGRFLEYPEGVQH